MKDNRHHVPKFSNSPKCVTVPCKNYPKANHKNRISREIDFKVSQAIKKISDNPKNKIDEVKMMPLDKPLKIRTCNDATHLLFDHLIEHEQFSINQMKTHFSLHHRLRENDRECSEAMKKMNKDVQSLKKNFNLLLNEFKVLFDPKITMKLHTIIDEIDATATMSSKSFKESRLHYDQIVVWLQDVNLCHNQNQHDIRNYLQEQAINQHRFDYAPQAQESF